MEELATGSGLLDGPVWDGGLVFSDVPNGGAYRLGEDGSIAPVFEPRRGIAVVPGPAGIGRDDPGTILPTRTDVPGRSAASARVALSPGIRGRLDMRIEAGPCGGRPRPFAVRRTCR